jgi:CRP-like cAMP-binding protein
MQRRDPDPRLGRLRAIPLFAACTRPELALVARNITEHHAAAGEVLIQRGWTGRELIVIVEGSAVVELEGRPIARLGPGDVAGEVALLDKGPRTATVVAETDIRALVSTAHEFALLLIHAPTLTRALLATAAHRLRLTTAQLTPTGAPTVRSV